MIKDISHITFIVKDLKKATEFFEKIFEAKLIYDSGEKQFSLSEERFFLIGNLWIVIMQGDVPIQKSYNHVAFKIDDCDYDKYKERIIELGVEIKGGRERISGEGRSLYFYDFDNHLFEIHTGTLNNRLAAYESSSFKQ